MNPASTPKVTVVVTTKDRKDELRNALRTTLRQSIPLELVVIDDGSSDGTSELVRSEFPEAVLFRSETSEGLVAQRNRGATLATTPFIVSIDDDCEFVSETTLERTVALFDHPRVAAVSIPYVNVKQDTSVRTSAPADDGIYVGPAYAGCAHMLRRDVFLALGGYRGSIFRQGEEPDYCIRLLDAGYVVRLGSAPPLSHFESPKRSHAAIWKWAARNAVLFTWRNVPAPEVVGHLGVTTFNMLRRGTEAGEAGSVLTGLREGYAGLLAELRDRTPVSRRAYRLSRMLVRRRAVRLEELEGRLPPLRAVT